MALYIITYDINTSDERKLCIDNKINEISEYALNIFEKLWIIRCSDDTLTVLSQLKKCIDIKDSILVTRITEDIKGWVDDDVIKGIANLNGFEF